ncbi:alpha/beta hydrolase family protein [Aliikangiella maris]|uniref:Prolyl oligopeptidase family serine peptidase n=2 Tax=Aliikangiella maris TaxID=3162458 RepID=A0ABV2BRZ9_9GAMM
MKPITTLKLISIMLVLWVTFISSVADAKVYPLEYFALREVVKNVEVSPDGKKLALIKIAGAGGNPTIEIYDTDNLQKEPFRFNSDPMEIQNFYWLSNSHILVYNRQKVRDKIEGFNQGAFEYLFALFDLEKKKFKTFKETNASVVSVLPDKQDKVILSFSPGNSKSTVDERFRPLSYYEFDLKKGTKKLLYRGKVALGQIQFDRKGNPTFARGFDITKGNYLWFVRDQEKDEWIEVFSNHEDSFETFSIWGFDPLDKNMILVTAHNGKDKVGFWSYDYKNKKFAELIYSRSDVDVTGARYHSNTWKHPGLVTAIAYATDKVHYEYLDGNEGAIYQQLDKLIPNAHRISIESRAINEQTFVISNRGPHDPGSYYLLKNGKLQLVGSQQPLFNAEDLADVKYIQYKSRDGKDIRAYITIPKGKGPFPTIVMPHGGPFVQEVVEYDEWAQMLANNGYLVIQPQYRGSLGYGLEFYKSAFIKGGEGGRKMQDDKDDGIAYLIKEGLTDPDRVALYGWSYGGYSALTAATRTPQIHQCVIAGAAVSDPLYQVNFYRDRARGAQLKEQETMWVDSVSPVKEAEKVNVPLLIIHGSIDQRVPPKHAELYIDELKKHNKSYKYVELDGADHFYNTLNYDHQLKLYQSIIDFLKNDCGPGGL